MKLATVEQSRVMDSLSQDYDLSAELLMESAGAVAAREIIRVFSSELSGGVTSVLCGPGHNGGDGCVVARHLFSAGFEKIHIFMLETGKPFSPLLKKQLERLKKQGLSVTSLSLKNFRVPSDSGDLISGPPLTENYQSELKSSVLIIDALFGTGSRGCEAEVGLLVDFVNSLKTRVVSLDAPSGLDCDRGVFGGSAVKALMTLSFGLAKPGFFIAEGPSHTGELRVLPIGFPLELQKKICTTHFLFDERSTLSHFPKREERSHKANHGRLLVCAGSEGYWGAGVLAASSAYRMGTGYVLWASEKEPSPHIMEIPEVMTSGMDEALSSMDKVNAVAFGCGLGVNKKTAEALRKLKESGCRRVVLDADGITTAIQFGLLPLCESWVITPHSGELSRLIDKKTREIERDRIKAAFEGAEKAGCHVLLKGYRSVLVSQGKVTIINSGNSALATAGTGDVLTGMIGALLAQNLETEPAVAMAAYIHGRLADEWVKSGFHKGSLSASDLKESLPSLLVRLSKI